MYMLTTRSQKFIMFCIGFLSLVLAAVVLVPFKSIYKDDQLIVAGRLFFQRDRYLSVPRCYNCFSGVLGIEKTCKIIESFTKFMSN